MNPDHRQQVLFESPRGRHPEASLHQREALHEDVVAGQQRLVGEEEVAPSRGRGGMTLLVGVEQGEER